VPAPQGSQPALVFRETTPDHVPGAHGVKTAALSAPTSEQYPPAAHASQPVLPLDDEKVPAAHATQSVAASADWKRPLSHGWHALLLALYGLYAPAAQGTPAGRASDAQTCPCGHSTQPTPQPELTMPRRYEVLPPGPYVLRGQRKGQPVKLPPLT